MKRFICSLYSLVILAALTGCIYRTHPSTESNADAQQTQQSSEAGYTATEQKMLELGLVDIATLQTPVAVHLVYATPYNFMGRKLYNDLSHAFLLPQAAQQLGNAAKLLKTLRPDLSLIVYDAARPISIQREMWDMVKDTDMCDFVSDPSKGQGMHNYGAAVDLTLMDCTGHPLQMGSTYDFFGDEARITIEEELLRSGRITERELNYRKLLRRVMTESGFLTIDSEWWHFNVMDPDSVRTQFAVIE